MATGPSAGDVIATLIKPPITRHTLALYCGASNDHNPMHVDLDFARAAGADDVFAHGMLSMAYLGELVTRISRPGDILSLSARFAAIVPVGAQITCRAIFRETIAIDGQPCAVLDLEAADEQGEIKLRGAATIRWRGDE